MTISSPYYTYMVRCIDGTFYIGKTNNLHRRLRQHNGLITGGAYYTKFKRPVELVYFEMYATHKEAFRREFQLKKLSRKQKEVLCKSNFTLLSIKTI